MEAGDHWEKEARCARFFSPMVPGLQIDLRGRNRIYNTISNNKDHLQTERCKEDGRLLVNDSLIPLFLLKQICQERIYRFRKRQ